MPVPELGWGYIQSLLLAYITLAHITQQFPTKKKIVPKIIGCDKKFITVLLLSIFFRLSSC